MKFILLSDIHLTEHTPVCRLDDILHTQFLKLEYVLKNTDKFTPILQAGDLFDKPRSWKCLHKFSNLMNYYPDVEFKLVYGQHDTYLRTDSSVAINILEEFNVVDILNENYDEWVDENGQLINIYGCSWNGKIPVVQNKKKNYINILVIHESISNKELNFEYSSASKFLETHSDYDLILCGDIHKKFHITSKDGRQIVNTGSMLRLKADEDIINHEPCYAIYNTKTKQIEWKIIPHKPAIEVITREHIEKQNKIDMMLGSFIKSIENNKIESIDIIEIIKTILKNENIKKSIVEILAEVMED